MNDNTIKIIFEKLKIFLESKWMLVLIGFITVFSWYFKFMYFPYIILLVVLSLVFLVNASFISIVMLFFLLIAGDQNDNYNIRSVGFYITIAFLIPLIIIALKNIITNFRNYYYNIRKDWHLYSLVIMFIVMLISVFVSPIKGVSLGNTFLFGLNILILVLFLGTVELNENNIDKIVLSFIIVLWCLAIQVLLKFIDIYEPGLMWDKLNSKELHLGWLLSNHYMVIVNIAIIISIYYYIKARRHPQKILGLASIIVGIVLNVITGCRGGYLGFIIVMPLLIMGYIIYIKDWKHELPYIITIFILLIISIIILFSTGIIKEGIEHLKELGTNSHGRSEIYQYAINLFKNNYLIGTGAFSGRYYLQGEMGLEIFNYHNSFLQIAATCGIFGVISFLIYLGIVLFRLKGRSAFNFFVFIVFVYFFTHGLVDTLFFNRKLMPFLTVLIAMIPKKEVKIFSLEENV